MNFKKIVLGILFSLCVMHLSAQTELTRPENTEFYEPVPKVVTPAAKVGDAPSDAIILFDGKNLDNFIQDIDGPLTSCAAIAFVRW